MSSFREKLQPAAGGEAGTSDVDYRLLVPLVLNSAIIQAVYAIMRVTTSYRAIELDLPVIWIGVISATFAILPIFLAVWVGRFMDRGNDAQACWIGAALMVVVFGGPPEFPTRSDGLKGLQKTYGLTFKSFDPLDESGPITLAALTSGKVQAADVFTTTPQIISDHLVSLTDPKFNFAAQNVTPLVYKPAMTATITDTLNAISAKLTTAALLQIDTAVIVNHDSYQAVATGWLKANGLPY